MCARLQPSAAVLREYLMQSPIFDAARAELIERGLQAYLDQDPIAAASILIPQVEHVIRNLARLNRSPTYKSRRHRNGGWMLRNIDDLLRDERVIRALGDEGVHYLQVLFTDQRGWNLRHDACHATLPADAYTMAMCDRIFHALLLLGLVGRTPPPERADASRR